MKPLVRLLCLFLSVIFTVAPVQLNALGSPEDLLKIAACFQGDGEGGEECDRIKEMCKHPPWKKRRKESLCPKLMPKLQKGDPSSLLDGSK